MTHNHCIDSCSQDYDFFLINDYSKGTSNKYLEKDIEGTWVSIATSLNNC